MLFVLFNITILNKICKISTSTYLKCQEKNLLDLVGINEFNYVLFLWHWTLYHNITEFHFMILDLSIYWWKFNYSAIKIVRITQHTMCGIWKVSRVVRNREECWYKIDRVTFKSHWISKTIIYDFYLHILYV